MGKLPHQFQMAMERYRSMGLYMPAETAARSTPIGPVFTEDTASTFAAPTLGITSQYRRRVHTVVAGAANNVAGVRFPAAADRSLIRGTSGSPHTSAEGNKFPIGGYYCCITCRIETWPDNTSRFFVGVSAAGTNVAAADAGTTGTPGTLPDNTFGIMHETGDAADVIRVVQKGTGGNVTSTVISGGDFSPTVLAAGRMFMVECIAWANQSNATLLVWDVQEGASIVHTNVGTADNVFLGPQCVISNGSTAGNAPAIGVQNIYYFSGD